MVSKYIIAVLIILLLAHSLALGKENNITIEGIAVKFHYDQ